MTAIFRGFLSSAAISVVLFLHRRLSSTCTNVPGGWWRPLLAVAVGVVLAIIIDRVTEYFTGTHGAPVKDIVRPTNGGPATTILPGIVQG